MMTTSTCHNLYGVRALRIARSDGCGPAATHVPESAEAPPARREAGDQGVERASGDCSVAVACVAEAPQVQLEALELDDLWARNIGNREGSEVGLACHRADTGELGADALDFVVAVGVRVVDGDQVPVRFGGHVRPPQFAWVHGRFGRFWTKLLFGRGPGHARCHR